MNLEWNMPGPGDLDPGRLATDWPVPSGNGLTVAKTTTVPPPPDGLFEDQSRCESEKLTPVSNRPASLLPEESR